MKPTKYRAVKVEYGGITFDSKKELSKYKELICFEKLGLISDLKRQVAFAWTETSQCDESDITITKKRKYIADFTYTDKLSGEKMIVDVKGFITAVYKQKKKIVEALFKIKITEV